MTSTTNLSFVCNRKPGLRYCVDSVPFPAIFLKKDSLWTHIPALLIGKGKHFISRTLENRLLPTEAQRMLIKKNSINLRWLLWALGKIKINAVCLNSKFQVNFNCYHCLPWSYHIKEHLQGYQQWCVGPTLGSVTHSDCSVNGASWSHAAYSPHNSTRQVRTPISPWYLLHFQPWERHQLLPLAHPNSLFQNRKRPKVHLHMP